MPQSGPLRLTWSKDEGEPAELGMDLLSICVAEQDLTGKYNKIQNKLTLAVQTLFLLKLDILIFKSSVDVKNSWEWMVLMVILLRNEFDFWKVHGIMNTSGLLHYIINN